MNGVWMNMFNFFDISDQGKKLFKKYKFRPLLRVKMKLKINHKLELNVVSTATEFFIEIQVRNDIGGEHNNEHGLRKAIKEIKPNYLST